MNQLDALLNWAPEPYDQAKDSVVRIILRFLYQPSIIKTNQNFKISAKFYFTNRWGTSKHIVERGYSFKCTENLHSAI